MTSISLDELALVTGGRGQQQVQQQQPQAADQQQQTEEQPQQQQAGGFLSGFDQFLSFFQTDTFQQLLGGIRGLIQQFGQR